MTTRTYERYEKPATGDAPFMAGEYPAGTEVVILWHNPSGGQWATSMGTVTACPSGRHAGQHALHGQVFLAGSGSYFQRYGTGFPELGGQRGLWHTLSPLGTEWVTEIRQPS